MRNFIKKHHRLCFMFCMISNAAFTQAEIGIENYFYFGKGMDNVWMPILHYQAKNGFYSEVRYNYEDLKTVSFYGGKTLSGGKSFQYNITPISGFSLGTFTGVSLAINAEAEWKQLFMSTQTQYSIGTRKEVENFFYSWSEFGYNVFPFLFSGVSIQHTIQQGNNYIETGFVTGFTFNGVSIPLYVFNPFKTGTYFVLGLNYDISFKKKQ